MVVLSPWVQGMNGMKTRYALRIAYDGTLFKGWQIQPHSRTVQGELCKALTQRFAGQPIRLLGASRTDTGVHARGQAAHCDLPIDALDGDAVALLEHQINRILPDDVRVFDLRVAPPPKVWQTEQDLPWHAIANSRGKVYEYALTARRGSQDPLSRLYRAHVAHPPIDLGVLDQTLSRSITGVRVLLATRERESTSPPPEGRDDALHP